MSAKDSDTTTTATLESVDVRPVCAGCGKPLPFVHDGVALDGNVLHVALRVDWRAHVMCAMAMLRKPGDA